jgi:hypothetical protein
LYDYRWEADYGGGPVTADLDALLSEVDSFLIMARELLGNPSLE